jgi:hypothetical protein
MTPFDKAIVALIGSAIVIANTLFGLELGFNEAAVTAVVSALTPLAVYLIPNKRG